MRAASLLGLLLELIEDLAPPGPLPAKARIGRFFRARRYLGSRDRRLISATAFAWLRHRPRGEARWDAWALRAGLPPARELTGREAPLCSLFAMARDGLLPWEFSKMLATARELLPDPPSPWNTIFGHAEQPDALDSRDWPAESMARLSAELSLPGWMARRLVDEYGLEVTRQLAACLLEEAPVDLRVNLSRTSREEVARALEEVLGAGRVELTPRSPLGLRLLKRRDLGSFASSHPGWFEVQDEGSQLIVLSADPRPGDFIIDACAGAGGKTLVFLDLKNAREGTGEIHACDVNSNKLDELQSRAEKLGKEALERKGLALHLLAPEGPFSAKMPAGADLVLVDAPCSGSGTLRRNPELKYRYGPEDLKRFAGLQGAILRRFAPLVRSGGRLVYTTCSLFEEENGGVVDLFLKERADFEEISSDWASSHLPAEALSGSRLQLNPLFTATDGFFMATLRRQPKL